MSTPSSVMIAAIFFMFFLYFCVRLAESESASHSLGQRFCKWAKRPLAEKLFILVFVAMMVAHGGSKSTNSVPQGGGGNAVAVVDQGTVADGGQTRGLTGEGLRGASLLTGMEPQRLSTNQYAAGFALLTRTLTNSAWLAVPSNAVAHAPWGRYGLAEDTFWLPATNWAFVLGTNAVDGAHVSSSGTLSFDPATPKGSPRAAAMPDGDTLSFLAPLQGSLGTVPPQGRFWHAVTTNGSVLMTWQDLFAGRDTNSPVTFQAELFRNGDFSYRYAFTNALALTNFVVGAQHNGGGETYALNDTNRLANGLELRWRAFGALDPGIDDHDGDGFSTYDEVMTWDTDPAMPDTDLDGLGDADETASALNPLARDTDGDGVPDGSDPHPLDPSGDTVDADGDGLPDSWETRWFGSTNATDSADADSDGDGFNDRAELLAGANPAFAACVVTASGGSHTFTWTVLPDATNYAATVTRGGAAVWSCQTNVCFLSVTGDFSTAVHTLTVTASGGPAPRTATVTFRQPSQPNLTVWKIADPFALELPQGCTNVMERTFRINRSNAWQQYFVSSRHDSAGAWALDGLRLDWSDSGGGSGSATASPAGDSLRLAASTDSPQTLTVRIVPEGAGGTVRSPKPLFLLGWSPAVTFSSTGTVSIASADGSVLVAVSDRDGGATAASFTVDRGGRPGNAAPGADETLQQSDPFGPESGVSFAGSYAGGAVAGGTVIAGAPGEFPLPSAAGGGGTGGGGSSQPPPPPPGASGLPSAVCLISPVVSRSGGVTQCNCDYSGTDSYPFDSACLREAWRGSGGCPEGNPAGISVTLGSEALDARFPIRINGDAGASLTWGGDGDTAHVEAGPEGTPVWEQDVAREPSITEGGCTYIWEDRECGDCGSCADGDCSSAEGESPGSVRFRIPLGFTGKKQMAGFVWFHLETPQPITPDTFTVTGSASVHTEHTNGTLSRAFSDAPGGRDVRFVPVDGGVRVSVRDTGDAAEDRAWLITSDADSVTFRKTDSAANTVLNVSYVHQGDGYWVRTDNATDLTKTHGVSGSVTNGVEVTEDIVRDGALQVLSGRYSSRTLVGTGSAAVVREILRYDWDGAGQAWRETRMTWWVDSLNPLLNGRPKFRHDDGGGDWEYRAHDARGRETLRVEPLDGSAQPFFKDDAEPFAFSPAASYASLTGLVTVTSYAPAPGDGGALNDSRKPREISVYAVRGGAPSLISREWRVYTRDTNDVWQTVTRSVIRAVSPAAGPDDAANARTLTVAYADDDDDVPALLRGQPLREERGDGTLLTWEYALNAATLTVTSMSGTSAHPDGLANVSTYGVETLDAVFGRTLGRETRLYTGVADGVLLASEAMTYDAQGRLLATTYSDGTSESNVWSCCRLEAKIGRDGSRTDYLAVPGNEHWSVVEETSAGTLPGAGGSHPAVETFTDALGRETNSVRCVWRNGSRDSAYTPLATRTEYPFGTGNHVVATDPLGVQTVTRTYRESNAEITEAASASVTNRTIRVQGGATVEEKYWDGKWTRETRSTAYDETGRRVETVTAEGSDCPVFVKSVTTFDFLGREVSVATPLGVTSNFYDGASDRVIRMSRTGSPDTLYVYDALGNVTATALDADCDAQVSYAGSDRISSSVTRYAEDDSNVWWRVTSSAESVGGVTNNASEVREQLTGLSLALLSRTVTLASDGTVTTATRAFEPGTYVIADTSQTETAAPRVSRTLYGYELESAGPDSSTLLAYDGFARCVSQTVTNGTETLSITALAYDVLGNAVTNETTYGSLTAVTATGFDEQGRAVSRTDALGNSVFTQYDSLGQTLSLSGATYPATYGYDTAGRMTELSTTRDGETWDTTLWLYNHATGLLTNKVYADNSRVSYTYTQSGQTLRTTWARDIWKENAYDALGQLESVSYSDATPAVPLARNAFGTVTNVTDASGLVHGFAVNDRQAVTNETVIFGAATNTLTRLFDGSDRPVGILLDTGYSLHYGYDDVQRVSIVSNAVFNARYGYGNGYVTGHTLTLSNGNTLAQAMTRDQYRPSLLTAVTNLFNGVSASSLVYAHDVAGRVTNRNSDTFGYNFRSELVSALLGASNYGYAYDAIGNRIWSAENTLTNSYTANSLNQYTAAGSVTPVYDADGNMRWDGRMWHTWDAENRLTRSEPGWGGATNGAVMTDSGYDYRHRRYSKTVRRLSGRGAGYPLDPSQGGTWDIVATHTFVYDGWNLVCETVSRTDGVTNVFEYFWGMDLSGTLQGAGGVGGLLAARINDAWYFPLYDNNGNITDYVDAAGNIRAHYEYSPFGETIAQSGDLAHIFMFRFSTKYWDEETHSYYYGYRHYAPELGCWLSKDPIGEEGGVNLYGFVRNDSINKIDALGERVLIVNKRNLFEDNIVGSSCGSGRGKTRVRMTDFRLRCVKCVFKIYGNFERIMYVLKPSHEAWEEHFPRYDKKWAVPRSNAREREATIAHENDHWKAAQALENLLQDLNSMEGKRFNSCADRIVKWEEQIKTLWQLFEIRTRLFEYHPWNQGGMYE